MQETVWQFIYQSLCELKGVLETVRPRSAQWIEITAQLRLISSLLMVCGSEIPQVWQRRIALVIEEIESLLPEPRETGKVASLAEHIRRINSDFEAVFGT